MDHRTLTRLYDVHSWTGVLTGLFLFVLCFSGTVALFYNELEPWERPAARGVMPDAATPIDAIVRANLPEPIDRLDHEFFVFLPEPYRPTLQLRWFEHGHDHETVEHWFEFDPVTGTPLGKLHEGAGYFLRILHTDLHLPSPIGRYVVGLGGIVMLLAIVTGVLTHRKILRNLLVFRPDRSRRLAWTDSHNVLGVWGLPFHAMIAFTGALLGLANLFLIVLALAAFQGDQRAALEAVVGEHPAGTGRAAEMVSLDTILDDARQRSPNADSVFMTVYYWADAGAEAHVRMEGFDNLNWVWEHRYALATGAHLESWSLGDHPGGRVYTTITPLHYGTYGGLALKVLYTLLGLGSSVLIATGLMVWIERQRTRQSATSYRALSGLVVGTTAGMAVATAAVLLAHHLVLDDPNRVLRLGVVFFGTWIAASLYAMLRDDNYRSLRELTLAVAVMLAWAPLVEIVATWNAPLIDGLRGSGCAFATNLALWLTAAAVFYVRTYLPRQRAVAPRPTGRSSKALPTSPAVEVTQRP